MSDAASDEFQTKRRKVAEEENEENVEKSAPVEAVQKVKEDATGEAKKESSCAICFETSSEVNMQGHECEGNTCKPDSWRVCDVCNGALLSRLCPFCKGNYASLPFHLVEGYPLSQVRNPSISLEQKLVTTMKIAMLKEEILPGTNALVLLPSGIAMFSLSNNKSEDSAGNDEQKEQENTLVLVRAKLDDNAILKERLATPEKFLFNNAVWDLLEKISEEGNADDNYAETVSVAEGSKKMILSCMDPEAKLFLPIEPEVFAQLESTWAAEIRASQ
jgi:hypothetical protein